MCTSKHYIVTLIISVTYYHYIVLLNIYIVNRINCKFYMNGKKSMANATYLFKQKYIKEAKK